METKAMQTDVVVVGASPVGSSTALNLARCGLHVILLEAQSIDRAGPQWNNCLPPWMFDRAQVDRPVPPERLCGERMGFLFYGPKGKGHMAIEDSPMHPLDMKLFNARLVKRLESHRKRVTVYDHCRAGTLEFQGDRPVLLHAERSTPEGEQTALELSAKLFVDAAGLEGHLLRQSPQLRLICPELAPQDTCSAMQETCTVLDPEGAQGFLNRYRAKPGEMISIVGSEGGYSTLSINVAETMDSVELLTGTIHDGQHLSGPGLMKRFKSEEPWIGVAQASGAGLIPIRRPFDRFTAPGIAAIGDAARHVIPIHASGVGGGMIAGRILAERVSRYYDPGSLDATWDALQAFQRELGAVFGAYDVFRRLSQTLRGDQIDSMLDAGLLNAGNFSWGMAQKMTRIGLADMLQTAKGSLAHPGLAAKFGPVVARMFRVHAHYKHFPKKPSLKKLRAWSHKQARLSGGQADIP